MSGGVFFKLLWHAKRHVASTSSPTAPPSAAHFAIISPPGRLDAIITVPDVLERREPAAGACGGRRRPYAAREADDGGAEADQRGRADAAVEEAGVADETAPVKLRALLPRPGLPDPGPPLRRPH